MGVSKIMEFIIIFFNPSFTQCSQYILEEDRKMVGLSEETDDRRLLSQKSRCKERKVCVVENVCSKSPIPIVTVV